MSFWGLSQGVGTLAGTLVGGLLGAADWRRPFLVLTVVGVVATRGVPVHLRHPARAERAGAGRGVRRRRRVRLPDQPARPAADPGPPDQRLADPAGLHRAGRVRLAGLAAGAVPGPGRGPGLLGRRPRSWSAASSPRCSSSAGCCPSWVGWSATGCSGAPRAGRALVAAVGMLAAVPFYVVLFFVPMRIDVPDGAGAGAVVGAVLASVFTEPTVGLSLLTALLALGADLGQLAELVRADRRRQPAGAPGHRLQPRQPGQRGRPGGRQRAWSAVALPRRWRAPSRRR